MEQECINCQMKIEKGEYGYVLEDVPHLTDYIPNLNVITILVVFIFIFPIYINLCVIHLIIIATVWFLDVKEYNSCTIIILNCFFVDMDAHDSFVDYILDI